jgi:hypothetical protein
MLAMKNISTILVFALATFLVQPTSISAQSFIRNNVIISAGLGESRFTSTIHDALDVYWFGRSFNIAPLFVKGECAISKYFGIGFAINYANSSTSHTYDKYTYSSWYKQLNCNIRGNYHLRNTKRFDPYFGLGLGYSSGFSLSETNNPLLQDAYEEHRLFNMPLGFEGVFGTRVYLVNNIALYAEVGPAESIIQAGVSIRFSTKRN